MQNNHYNAANAIYISQTILKSMLYYGGKNHTIISQTCQYVRAMSHLAETVEEVFADAAVYPYAKLV